MSTTNKVKILHADDSWFIRQGIKKFLETENFEYIEAENGQIAYERIIECKPDCILLDLLMPELDGVDVLEKLLKNDIIVPAIILSADVQKTTMEKCLDLGAFAFLNKPPNKQLLLKTIESAIKINKLV